MTVEIQKTLIAAATAHFVSPTSKEMLLRSTRCSLKTARRGLRLQTMGPVVYVKPTAAFQLRLLSRHRPILI